MNQAGVLFGQLSSRLLTATITQSKIFAEPPQEGLRRGIS